MPYAKLPSLALFILPGFLWACCCL